MIITPDYYKKFNCISSNCKHNCCIGWEIEIDNDTFEKYQLLKGDFSNKIRQNIKHNNTPYFKLDANERCPFLNKDNLCDIIIYYGEDMLCQICSDHPRFRNFFEGRTEIGLGLCCEQAAKIILTNQNKVSLISDTGNLPDDSFFAFRNSIFDVLQNRNFTITQRVQMLIDRFDIPSPINTHSWSDFYKNLEMLDPDWENHLKNISYSQAGETTLEVAYEQLLVYLTYRHLADALYDNMFIERISFIILSYQIIRSMNISDSIEELLEISRMYSSEIEYSDENIYKILDFFAKEKTN